MNTVETWKARLDLPRYRVADAARYAGTSTQTVGRWQRMAGDKGPAIATHDPRQPLSYLELIEIGVVAAMRMAGVKLAEIRKTRAYMAHEFGSKHPFAEYRFKTDGAKLLLNAEEIDHSVRDHLLETGNGQYAFRPVLERLLRSFDYPVGGKGPVERWTLQGDMTPVIIDPRISFGDPTVNGIPTRLIHERHRSGDTIDDISEDFGLTPADIDAAIAFEADSMGRKRLWTH